MLAASAMTRATNQEDHELEISFYYHVTDETPSPSLSPFLLHSGLAAAPGLCSPVNGARPVVWVKLSNQIFLEHFPRVTGVTNILKIFGGVAACILY